MTLVGKEISTIISWLAKFLLTGIRVLVNRFVLYNPTVTYQNLQIQGQGHKVGMVQQLPGVLVQTEDNSLYHNIDEI